MSSPPWTCKVSLMVSIKRKQTTLRWIRIGFDFTGFARFDLVNLQRNSHTITSQQQGQVSLFQEISSPFCCWTLQHESEEMTKIQSSTENLKEWRTHMLLNGRFWICILGIMLSVFTACDLTCIYVLRSDRLKYTIPSFHLFDVWISSYVSYVYTVYLFDMSWLICFRYTIYINIHVFLPKAESAHFAKLVQLGCKNFRWPAHLVGCRKSKDSKDQTLAPMDFCKTFLLHGSSQKKPATLFDQLDFQGLMISLV